MRKSFTVVLYTCNNYSVLYCGRSCSSERSLMNFQFRRKSFLPSVSLMSFTLSLSTFADFSMALTLVLMGYEALYSSPLSMLVCYPYAEVHHCNDAMQLSGKKFLMPLNLICNEYVMTQCQISCRPLSAEK